MKKNIFKTPKKKETLTRHFKIEDSIENTSKEFMTISKDLRTRAKHYTRAIPAFLIYMWIRSSLMNLPIDFKKLGSRYF
jgi:hypothetical protein